MRIFKMAEQYFGGVVRGDATHSPSIRTKLTTIEAPGDVAGLNIPYIITNDILPRYHKHMSVSEINKAADVIWELIGHLDQFVTDYEPFKLVKTDKDKAEAIIWGLLYGLREVAQMLVPIMPDTAEKIELLVGASSALADEAVFNTKALTEPLFMRK